MKIAFISMVLVIALASCGKKIVPNVTKDKTITDSTVVTIETRVDTLKIKGDTVYLDKLIDCGDKGKLKPFVVQARSGRESLRIQVDKNGRLTATAICDSLWRLIEIKDREIYRLRKESSSRIESTPVYLTRKIDIICRYVAGGLLLLLVGYGVARFRGIV